MLYRDNLRLKHSVRPRLQQELDSAKLAEEMQQTQADRESGLLELATDAADPLTRALLSHLQEVVRVHPHCFGLGSGNIANSHPYQHVSVRA